MSKSIEGTRPLDANIEKKNLEGTYIDKSESSETKIDSWDLTEQTRKRDQERKARESLDMRFGGLGGFSFSKAIAEPLPKPRFTAIDIGKATINTPTQDKREAQRVEDELEALRESSLDELDK